MLKPRGLRTMHFSSSLSSLLTLTLNIPPSRFLNQPGPFPIKRDVIPVKPLSQRVPDLQPDPKMMRGGPDITFNPSSEIKKFRHPLILVVIAARF